MHIPTYLKYASKVIGYFSYTNFGEVCCDGDACIIAGTEEKMRVYINRIEKSNQKDIIKKTRFGEIINGMRQGGAYSFDKESYNRFYDIAITNGVTELPAKETFLEKSDVETHFMRIQIVEL